MFKRKAKIEHSLKEVAWTGMVTTFYCDYADRTELCVSKDRCREELVKKLSERLKKEHLNPYNILTPERIPNEQIMNVAVRKKKFDGVLQQILNRVNADTIVNIGCGFDTRYQRLSEFDGIYYDVDLPEVIYWKRKYLQETEQYHMIGTRRAFGEDFFSKLRKLVSGRAVFLVEGVFCYYPYHKVMKFVSELFEVFPEAVLLCDTFLYQENFQFSDNRSRFQLKYPRFANLYDRSPALFDRYMQWRFRRNESEREDLGGQEEQKYDSCLEQLLLTDVSVSEAQAASSYWIGAYEKRSDQADCLIKQLAKVREAFTALGQFDQVRETNQEIMNLEIQAKKTNVMYYPSYLQLEHTDICNAGCIMCSHCFTKNHGASVSGQAMKEVFQAVLPSVRAITLQGMGEPFLHPQIISIINEYHKLGIRMNCSTNASVMSKELAEAISRAFYDINISCDACTKETYEKIRTGLTFETFCENVRMLREHAPDLKMQMAVVAMRQNVKELPGIVQMAAEFGFQTVTIMDVTTQILLENEVDSLRNYPTVASEYLAQAEETAKKLRIACSIPGYLMRLPKTRNFEEELEIMESVPDKEPEFYENLYRRYEKSGFFQPVLRGTLDNYAIAGNYHCTGLCRMAAEHPFIDIKGNLFLCCTSWMHYIGNVYSDGGFDAVWNGEVMQKIRSLFYEGTLPKYCEGCVFLRDEMVTGIRVTDLDREFYHHNYDETMKKMLEEAENV